MAKEKKMTFRDHVARAQKDLAEKGTCRTEDLTVILGPQGIGAMFSMPSWGGSGVDDNRESFTEEEREIANRIGTPKQEGFEKK